MRIEDALDREFAIRYCKNELKDWSIEEIESFLNKLRTKILKEVIKSYITFRREGVINGGVKVESKTESFCR